MLWLCSSVFFGWREQKSTVWSRPNKGVNARAARDIELEAIERPKIETSYAILERKSRIYEKLDKGKDAGLSEKQYGSLLVDVGLEYDEHLLVGVFTDQSYSASSTESRWMTNLLERKTWMKV
jgi:hypothetical protein